MCADLLEDLTRLAGCDYLSDLPSRRFRGQVLRALEILPPERYPAAQWQEALRYLLASIR